MGCSSLEKPLAGAAMNCGYLHKIQEAKGQASDSWGALEAPSLDIGS